MGDDPIVAARIRAAAAGDAWGSVVGTILGAGILVLAMSIGWGVAGIQSDAREAEERALRATAEEARQRFRESAAARGLDLETGRLGTLATDASENASVGGVTGTWEAWDASSLRTDGVGCLLVRVVAPGDPDYARAWPVYPVDEETAARARRRRGWPVNEAAAANRSGLALMAQVSMRARQFDVECIACGRAAFSTRRGSASSIGARLVNLGRERCSVCDGTFSGGFFKVSDVRAMRAAAGLDSSPKSLIACFEDGR